MLKKIVISHFNSTAAILQSHTIQEIITINANYQVQDIYLGVVQKIFISINAAFVFLGKYKKSGFIHINDIKSLKKNNNLTRITDVISVNQLIIVQIVKEPTLNKGPRLTTNINLFGRYLVLMPFCNTIRISCDIYDENERSYLHSLAILLKPATMGLSIRSSAVGVNEKILLEDLSILKNQWYCIQKLAVINSAPALLYKDDDLVKKIIRDNYTHEIQAIIADSTVSLNQVRYYLNQWKCLDFNNSLKLHLFKQSESILDSFSINLGIIKALNPKVNLSIGGYLFIETYEAFTIIDVNSGSFNQVNSSKETIVHINCYAATEIAYQLKVRNINGVIIVDFIDMESQKDQLQLLEHFARVLSIDNAKPQIIQLSKLGLVELTRRRRQQSLFELFHNKYINYPSFSTNSSVLCDQYSINNCDFLHKSIKELFFSTFFSKTLYLSNTLIYNQNSFTILNSYRLIRLYLNHPFIVPLMLYSQVINFSFRTK